MSLSSFSFRRAAGALAALTAAPALHAQTSFTDIDVDVGGIEGVGWSGFTDVEFLLTVFLELLLAAALAAILAYHPRIRAGVDTVDEAELPKVAITYSVIGAIIGIMVVRYGLVVGFVVFGIGGLFRFKTALASTAGTGQLILMTLVGLSCGLGLPHLGVLATAFGYAMIFLLTTRVTHQVTVNGLERQTLSASADAYRGLLERHRARVIREERSPAKKRVRLVVRASHRFESDAMEEAFESEVPEPLRGTVDWEVE